MRVIASQNHRQHDAFELTRGQLLRSTEAPRRADTIAHSLREAGHSFEEPATLDRDLLLRVHTPEYVHFLSTAWDRWQARGLAPAPAMAFAWPGRGSNPRRPDDLLGQLGYHSFGADCSIVQGTWPAAEEAAGVAVTAARHALGDSTAVYALCRPPGHHATADQFGGYCYLNNSAIAAQSLLDTGLRRVTVLDIDYHHGNGTQSVFYARSDVLSVSIHADPDFEFPWFSGHADESGAADGEGWNLNLPLAAGSTLKTWLHALDRALDRIAASRSEALVVALGVDTYKGDPLGTFTLDTSDYTTIATRIRALDVPTVIVQEGGYATDAIGDNVAAFLEAFD